MNPPVFWILAAISVVSAVIVILKRNPLASALALAVNLVALAGLFAGLSAAFLFAIQILVYAGAVVVLIIFVIMLLNLGREELREQSIQKSKFAASALLCLLAAALLMRAVAGPSSEAGGAGSEITSDFGHVEAMADVLFTRYLLPFEVVSLILLVGIVGAVVVAKRGE
jgi:NADH-quinone oxidoreductase subunit J